MMDINKYFEELNTKLNSLSNEELEKLLIESGIQNCPLEEECFSFNLKVKTETNKISLRDKKNINDFSNALKKVA